MSRSTRPIEAAFRGYAEVSSVAALWVGAEGQATWCNAAWTELSGLDAEETLGRGWVRAVRPEDRGLVDAGRLLTRELRRRAELVLHVQGVDVPVAISAAPVPAGSDIAGYFVTLQPLEPDEPPASSDVVSPSSEVVARDARFEALVAGGRDVVSVHDPDGTLRYVSPAVTANLGYAPEELVGRPTLELAHPDDRDRLVQLFRAQLDPGAVAAPVEYRIRHRDGTWQWFEGSCSNLIDDPSVGGIVINARNVTDRYRAEALLRETEARQRAILENVSELVVIIDAEGRMSESTTGTMVLGYPEGFGAGRNILHFVHPDDRDRVLRILLDKLGQPGFTEPIEVRLRHLDGTWRHCEAIGNNQLADPVVQGAIITIRDITDRKQAEVLLARQSLVLEMVARAEPVETVLEALVRMIEEQADRARAAIVRFGPSGGPAKVVAPALPDGWTIGAELATSVAQAGWVTFDDRAGAVDAPAFGWSSPVADGTTGRKLGAVLLFPAERRFPLARERQMVELAGSLASIAIERLQALEELAFRASHDPLTALPTRAVFQEHLRGMLAGRRSDDRVVAVFFIDLDRFKDVNDGIGHDRGDQVLRTIAHRLDSSLRAGDVVARFGGDEFVVLAMVEGPEHARMVADRLLDEIAHPVAIGGHTVEVSASVGIALPSNGQDGDALVRDADVAMYRAKQRGRSRAEFFDDALRSGMMARIDLESGLRQALARDEFVLEYQPVVEIGTGHVKGIEALLRWRHPDGRLVPPAEFIPLAEETGLIVPMGQWVLEQSSLQAARWREMRPDDPPMVLAVNLSARQLAHPGLVSEVAAAIDAAGADASTMSLEITESVLLDDLDGTLRVLDSLRELGVKIVIDDFGTGYSSLRYLKRLPVDVLKIDREFVSGLGHDSEDTAIVRAVIELAHALDLSVVAEGVEEPVQLHELERFGCDYAQGFLFAHPEPAEVIDGLLMRSLLPDVGIAG